MKTAFSLGVFQVFIFALYFFKLLIEIVFVVVNSIVYPICKGEFLGLLMLITFPWTAWAPWGETASAYIEVKLIL